MCPAEKHLLLARGVRGFKVDPKVLRYGVVTIGSVVLGQSLLAVLFDVLRLSATTSNVAATALMTGPAYIVNRSWVWQKKDTSNRFLEVMAFWTIAALGLALSTVAVTYADRGAIAVTSDRLLRTAIVVLASCFGYGVVWILRYFVLDRYVFRTNVLQDDPIFTADRIKAEAVASDI